MHAPVLDFSSGIFLSALVGYFLGSVPFGLLVARSRGIDIRKHGSGNIGATNVFRTMGRNWGLLVFALDALKGLAAVLVAEWGFGPLVAASGAAHFSPAQLGIAGALACIVGHNFPVWLRFKGGKGVATTAGVLVGLIPVAAVTATVAWLILFYATRYVSLASLAAAVAIPVTVGVMQREMNVLFGFSLLVAVLAIWRHRSNIQRLLAGTENRFAKKK